MLLALALFGGLGVASLSQAEPAAAVTFECHYVIVTENDCGVGTLPPNNASGWSSVRNFYAHRATSNYYTQYRKSLAIYKGQLFGWWYGGKNALLFERINNNGTTLFGYQAICRNSDDNYFPRQQTMFCQTVR
ncbi:hypothetical protein [Miltoncostaea oceani]|uniref:hypothetical protein n=1 Tax=Miltoncostaea oceani TaxID=2843216 RepID=UPI001C3D2B08|nr:hypothetical protein [Miltoncostaea oceani]